MRLVGPSDIESLSAILLIPNGEAIFYGHFCPHTLCVWLAQVDSNHRPRAYQARALTTWAMSQFLKCRMQNAECRIYSVHLSWLRTLVRWWRWWDSNPWPPACRAGALPTELHPHIWVVAFSPERSFKIEQWFESKCTQRNRHLCRIHYLCMDDSP